MWIDLGRGGSRWGRSKAVMKRGGGEGGRRGQRRSHYALTNPDWTHVGGQGAVQDAREDGFENHDVRR